MMKYIPGTVLEFKPSCANDCYSVIAPLLTVTGGLTLSQVKALTGLQSSTIQNWVKRGWVKNPAGKRYGEAQVVRIILINMMRGSMQMEQIIYLMSYINGSVEDNSDDILPDRELFDILCGIIYDCDNHSLTDSKFLDAAICEGIHKAAISDDLAQTKLKTALKAMVLAYFSTQIKDMAQAAFSSVAGTDKR